VFPPLTLPFPLRSDGNRGTVLLSSGYALNSAAFRFIREEFEEGSKGIKNPLRAYARASSENTISSFTPEGYKS